MVRVSGFGGAGSGIVNTSRKALAPHIYRQNVGALLLQSEGKHLHPLPPCGREGRITRKPGRRCYYNPKP